MQAFVIFALILSLTLSIQAIIRKIQSAIITKQMRKEKDILNAKIVAHLENRRYVRL